MVGLTGSAHRAGLPADDEWLTLDDPVLAARVAAAHVATLDGRLEPRRAVCRSRAPANGIAATVPGDVERHRGSESPVRFSCEQATPANPPPW
ncbi:hypothetical protein [Nocardia xishanensis]